VTTSMAVIIRSLTLNTLPPRVQDIGISFLLWRLLSLRITIMPFAAEGLSVPTDISVGFSSVADESAPPNTFERVLQDMTVTTVCSFGMTQPAVMNIPSRVLKRKQQPWLRVISVTGDTPGEVSAGQLQAYSRVAVTGTFVFLVDGICEFTQPSDSGFDLRSRLLCRAMTYRDPKRGRDAPVVALPCEDKEACPKPVPVANDSSAAEKRRPLSDSEHDAIRALLRQLSLGVALAPSETSWADQADMEL